VRNININRFNKKGASLVKKYVLNQYPYQLSNHTTPYIRENNHGLIYIWRFSSEVIVGKNGLFEYVVLILIDLIKEDAPQLKNTY
jgi:hypothetical protein